MFSFKFIPFSVDATHSTGFGRMINDATLPDANCKIMIFSGCTVGPQAGVHLCVFAIKTIETGKTKKLILQFSALDYREIYSVSATLSQDAK